MDVFTEEDSMFLKCTDQCTKDNEPLKTFTRWWKTYANEFDISLCLLNMALELNL